MPYIKLELPSGMHDKISEILEESEIFETHEDVMMHAILDLLEQYNKRME